MGKRALNEFLNIVREGIYSTSIVFGMNSCVILPIEDVIPYQGAWMSTYSTLCSRESHRIILMCWFDYNSEKLFWCFVSKRWRYIPGTMKPIFITVEFPTFLGRTLTWIKSKLMFIHVAKQMDHKYSTMQIMRLHRGEKPFFLLFCWAPYFSLLPTLRLSSLYSLPWSPSS